MNVSKAAKAIIECFKSGNKLLICGNGGSATMASHMAGEFVGKFETLRRPLPAISLFDLATFTAIANDDGYDHVFVRPIQALAQPGDILICFSTSRKSKNLINAISHAEILMLSVIQAPIDQGESTAQIQEHQLKWLHDVCREVEKAFL